MNKKELFLQIFKKAEAKYGRVEKRLAAEDWKHDWQTLIATIYSAQSRDETTIPVMESLFEEFPTLKKLANAPLRRIKVLTRRINYYKTKSKNAKATAQMLLDMYNREIPRTIEELTELPGVGRKTANLVLSEIYAQDTITVDTHVHRLANVLGLVKTETPVQTELALQKIAPRRDWSRINRIFVLWGKEVRGRERKKLMKKLEKQEGNLNLYYSQRSMERENKTMQKSHKKSKVGEVDFSKMTGTKIIRWFRENRHINGCSNSALHVS